MKKFFLLLSTGIVVMYGVYMILHQDPSPGLGKPRATTTPKPVSRLQTTLPQQPTQTGPVTLSSKPLPANKPKPSLAKIRKLAATYRKPIPLAKKRRLTVEDLAMLHEEEERMEEAEEAEEAEERESLTGKNDEPEKFALFHRLIRTREGAERPAYPMNYKFKALAGARTQPNRNADKRVTALNWSERGPGNVPGRTRGLLVLPTDPQKNTWLAGSASGGIWKTTDGGSNWKDKTPDFPDLATTTLALCAKQPNVIYAGTGEAFGNADGINGEGIFKSTDGGESWTQLAATANDPLFRNVNRIIVDPNDPDVVVACTSTYGSVFQSPDASVIARSEDGGTNWELVVGFNTAGSAYQIQQLVASPDTFAVQYATVNSLGVIKSIDGGKNWDYANKGMAPVGRVEMAIAPTDPSRLYASAQGNLSGGNSDFYVSEDAGATWKIVLEEGGTYNVDWLGGQGWYDNTIAVHPYDEDLVYVAGLDIFRMKMKPGETETRKQIKKIDQQDTQSFLSIYTLLTGTDWWNRTGYPVETLPEDFASVELRFGPGKTQKAHRFTVGGRAAGVPPEGYTYQDYVDVPFEVWDTEHNRQLMVSFRDQGEDGKFNLVTLEDSSGIGREYIFINAVPYNANNPDPKIAKPAGMAYKNIFTLWPLLPSDAPAWDPATLPKSKLVIEYGAYQARLREPQSVAVNIFYNYGPFKVKNRYVHNDHHNLVMATLDRSKKTFKVLNANDGGVFVSKVSTDAGVKEGDWIFAGTGYNTSQFYGADKKRGANEYIGGTQDNGAWQSPPQQQASAGSSYKSIPVGDGFEVAWHYAEPNKYILSSYNNGFVRTLDGGNTYESASTGITDRASGGPFISRIASSQSNPDVLFAVGVSGVWRSTNFGENWQLTPISDFWTTSAFAESIKVSLANPQIVWAGSGMSSTKKIHVSTDGGISFEATNNFPDVLLGSITGLATHPTEDSTAYALFSFSNAPKILRTRDLGQTWEDISGFGDQPKSSNGFPDVAVYSLLVMPNDPNIIWAGTEIGLVESTDGGATWALAQNGLPSVSIWQMKVVDDQVVLATHGRGIWSVTIPEVFREVVFVPYIVSANVAPNGKVSVTSFLRSAYDSTLVLVNGKVFSRTSSTQPLDTLVQQFAYSQSGTITVQLKSYVAGKAYVSTEKTLDFFTAKAAYTYNNAFNAPSTDFFGPGFSIRQEEGFADGALHSQHPYGEENTYTHQLKTPIIIARQEARFKYRDIALVEPGEEGYPFGSDGFYDYVVVEGTKDGVTWIPLEAGYDANYDEQWLDAYQNDLPGTDSLYRDHNVDLLKRFTPGDTVFFRFRLYSDQLSVGWGWAIDDLSIQEGNAALESFTLVSATTQQDIGLVNDGDTINLTRVGKKLNIRANTLPDRVGSVVFEFDGKPVRPESVYPYALAGGAAGNPPHYNAWTPSLGIHTLKATPYSKANGMGRQGVSYTVTFTVIDAEAVADFVLVNAETGQDIGPLSNGGVINLSQVGKKLNIRANTLPDRVGSVVFSLDGKPVRPESVYPYALAGGAAGNPPRYNAWTPSLGAHTLKATPYSEANGAGQPGESLTVAFEVVSDDALVFADQSKSLVAYPNPFLDAFTIDLGAEVSTEATIYLYNSLGREVYQNTVSLIAGSTQLQVNVPDLTHGIYQVRVKSKGADMKETRVIKK